MMEGIKIPVLRNCCFFIPLKEGLLVFTYISLVYHLALLVVVYMFTGMIVLMAGMGGGLGASDLPILIPLPLLMCLVAYNVHVIAAVHLTNVKGIKNSLLFGAVLWTITILICIYVSYNIIEYAEPPFGWHLAFVILQPLLQGYGLLLIRSLQLKLRGEGKFEYITMA